jgi:hypothetical protein
MAKMPRLRHFNLVRASRSKVGRIPRSNVKDEFKFISDLSMKYCTIQVTGIHVCPEAASLTRQSSLTMPELA